MKAERGAVVRGTLVAVILVVSALMASQAVSDPGVEKDPEKSRVPEDQIAEAKATKNPLPNDAATIAQGKELFEGKALCATCHGISGKGDGDAGKALDPGPRNFTNPKFHDRVSDGEMMWVLKNGSAGTGMIQYVPTIITEEEGWTIIRYDRTFKGK